MITVILTLIDLIGTSDYMDYTARTTTVGTTLIGDGIEAGEITGSTLTIYIIVLLFLIAHLSDRKWSYPRVEEQPESMLMVEEEKETTKTEYTKTEEDMKS